MRGRPLGLHRPHLRLVDRGRGAARRARRRWPRRGLRLVARCIGGLAGSDGLRPLRLHCPPRRGVRPRRPRCLGVAAAAAGGGHAAPVHTYTHASVHTCIRPNTCIQVAGTLLLATPMALVGPLLCVLLQLLLVAAWVFGGVYIASSGELELNALSYARLTFGSGVKALLVVHALGKPCPSPLTLIPQLTPHPTPQPYTPTTANHPSPSPSHPHPSPTPLTPRPSPLTLTPHPHLSPYHHVTLSPSPKHPHPHPHPHTLTLALTLALTHTFTLTLTLTLTQAGCGRRPSCASSRW